MVFKSMVAKLLVVLSVSIGENGNEVIKIKGVTPETASLFYIKDLEQLIYY